LKWLFIGDWCHVDEDVNQTDDVAFTAPHYFPLCAATTHPHAHRSGRALRFLNMPFESDRQYRQPTLPMATSARRQVSFPSDA
jgi:hypothetical protein